MTSVRLTFAVMLMSSASPAVGHSQEFYFHSACPSNVGEWLIKHPQDSASPRIYGERDGLDTPPRRLSEVAPSYPEEARKDGYEGQVVLMAVVEPSGAASYAEVVYTTVSDPPSPPLDLASNDRRGAPVEPPLSRGAAANAFRQASLRLIRQLRFEPGTKRGQPVRALVCLPVNYRIHR